MNAALPESPILVTDDNETDVFFLERRLHAAGIRTEVKHAMSGGEALRFVDQMLADPSPAARPWLLFIDLKMPGLDGFDVLKALQRRGAADAMTLVVLSTSDEPEDVQRAFLLGAHRYLVKYPQPAQLLEVVTFAAQRAGQRRAAPKP